MLVAYAAVHQQDGHVDDVEVGQDVAEAAGGAVRQRAHQVPGVVEVASHAPEARGHELAAVGAAVGRAVRALDVGGLAAPDGAGALGAAEQVLLVVGGAEDVVANQAEQQHGGSVGCAQLHRVVHQVETLQGSNRAVRVGLTHHETTHFLHYQCFSCLNFSINTTVHYYY